MNSQFILIAGIIKSARMAKQLSQIDLAKKVGCSPSLINNFERGQKRPTLEDAFRIEHILEMKEPAISNLIIAQDYRAATGQEMKPQQTIQRIQGLNEIHQEKPRIMGEVISVPVKLPKDIYLKLEFE